MFQNPFNQVTGSKLTVYDEIAYGLENFGVAPDEMRRRIDSAMEKNRTHTRRTDRVSASLPSRALAASSSVMSLPVRPAHRGDPTIALSSEPTDDPQRTDASRSPSCALRGSTPAMSMRV